MIFPLLGYLQQVRNTANTTLVYWQANAVNARGQVTQETLGNGLTTIRAYNAQTNRIQGINTGNGNVQNLVYAFDTLGNLTERKDLAQNLADTFSYDNLNRLTSTTQQDSNKILSIR